jgi:predicted permease
MLATGAGLLLRSFAHASRVDPGFTVDRVGVVQVFAYDRQDTAPKLRTFHNEILERISRIPGVVEAGSVSAMPLISANINIESPFVIEGRPAARPGEEPSGFLAVASPGYFSTMGIALTAGRALAATDDERAQPVAVITRTLAQRYWPGGDALGSWLSFRLQGQPQRRQVVGIVDAVRHDALELPTRDEIIIPFAQEPFAAITFVFKSDGNPAGLLPEARAAVWAVDPKQTIYEDGTAASLMADALAPRRFALLLSAGFAIVAFVLAAAGVYATMSYTIGLQIREFGVRLALGASTARVGRGVLRQGLTTCAVGIGIGLVAALLGSRAIESQLFGVSAFDPITLAGVVAGAVVVALAASFGPARRAMRTDPAVSLRSS